MDRHVSSITLKLRTGKTGRAYPLLKQPMLIALIAIGLFATAVMAQTFPVLTGRVVDGAELLSPAQEAEMAASLAVLEAKSSDQLVVVTVPSLEGYAIEDYGNRLARAWAVGQKGKDNGAVLVVAPNDRKVRIEVGRGLEPILTDALTSVIIQSTILPRFRRGDFAGGIIAGVKDITDSLTGDAAEVAVRARGGGVKPAADWTDWLPLLFWIAIVVVILWHAQRNQQIASRSSRYSRRRGRDAIITPGGWGSSGGWSGGSSGSSGGGFSGGGGSFGGGGSSRSW